MNTDSDTTPPPETTPAPARKQARKAAPRRLAAPPAEAPANVTPMNEAAAHENRVAIAQREVEKAQTAAAKQWAEDVAFATSTGCPMPPKKHPMQGDKTPAFVDWLHTYRLDEFKKRFGVIRRGKVPIIEAGMDGIDVVTGYRETWIASRKTHLTEVEQTDTALSDGESWDA
jgi:hypothetical protein